MFHKSLQRAQMAFPVIYASLNYTPAAAILQLELMNMVLQEADSAHPSEIPAYNE